MEILVERRRIMRKQWLSLWVAALAVAWGSALLPARARVEKAPAIVGDWEGTLDAGAQGKLRVVLHVTQVKDGSLSATMDSPDQNATGIPVTTITYKEPALHFESKPIEGSYDGKMNKENTEIAGDWSQGGATLSLVFKRIK
jgi:hypothetical protein